MDEFIQVLGAPLTSAPVQDLIARFRLVENVENPGHLNSPSLGIALRLDDLRAVDTVFLFGNGKDDFHEYRGPLPGALTFRHGRTEVRRVYGEPTSSERHDGGSGRLPTWRLGSVRPVDARPPLFVPACGWCHRARDSDGRRLTSRAEGRARWSLRSSCARR